MMVSRLVFRIVPFIASLFAFIIIALFYMLRPPVLMVSDPYFTFIYGTARSRTRQFEISMILFRPFIPVMVSENSASEIVVEAIKTAHKAPRAVFFPYHFISSARRLKDEFPDMPILVLEGRRGGNFEDNFVFVETDIEADYFKAGAFAALLVQEESGIVVFHEENFSDYHQAAFEKGLEINGFIELEEVVYIDFQSDYHAWREVSCVVVAGPASRFFDRGLDIPVILFSWMDPEITPRNVKVLFDDSPWAMAARSFRILEKGGGKLSSRLIFPPGRLEKAIIKELSSI